MSNKSQVALICKGFFWAKRQSTTFGINERFYQSKGQSCRYRITGKAFVYHQKVRQRVERIFQTRVGSVPHGIVHRRGYAEGNGINVLLTFHSAPSKHLSKSQHVCCSRLGLLIAQSDISSKRLREGFGRRVRQLHFQ